MSRTIVLTLLSCLTLGNIASAETIRVAYPKLPAFISVKDGKAIGPFAGILCAAAARADIQLTFVPLATTPAEMLANGAADAVAPSLIGDSTTYDFSAPILVTGGALYVRAPQPAPSNFAKLGGKTVATPTYGPFVAYIRKNAPGVKVLKTGSYHETLDDVIAGRADAGALNIDEARPVVAASYKGKISVPARSFSSLSLGLAVSKGKRGDLLKRLNTALASVRSDGSDLRCH